MQRGRRISDLTELELMMSDMSEEQKQRIRDKADRLEVLFKDEVVYMKDKDEGWDGMLPKGDAFIINEATTNNKGSK